MRDLLFISHRIPFPPDRGEKIRGHQLITHLAQHFRVHLGCLIDDPTDWRHVAHLKTLCADVAAFGIDKRLQKLKALARIRPNRPLMLDYYFHPGLRRWVEETAARTRPDVVYIFSTAMAPYALHLDCHARILDMLDVDSEKWALYARNSRWPTRAVWAREARTLLAYERHAAMQSDLTLFVTREEARRFAELAPETSARLRSIEVGVDAGRFSPDIAFARPYAGNGPHLVFTGNMDYWPNADAATWFAAEVLPRLRERAAGTQFHIVGANPGRRVLRLGRLAGVDVTGRVPDTRPYIAHADVAVAPLRMARGVQNKVLEAMALGRPVVASPQAFEGIRAVPGRDLLVADGAEAMAHAIIAIVEGRHPGLGSAARAVIAQSYSAAATLAPLDRSLAELLGRGGIAADRDAALARR
jgi:sugar transferase (PEP-CTERM/EpsH1 system associated)